MRNFLPIIAILGLAACAGPVEAPAPVMAPDEGMAMPAVEAAPVAVPVICDANGNCSTPGS